MNKLSKAPRFGNKNIFPIFCMLILILIVWYCFSILLNAPWAYDQAKRESVDLSYKELVVKTWFQKRPKLPAPHQVVNEMWDTIVKQKINSKRSLIYHSYITFIETIYGFFLGTVLGVLLALAIVHNRATALSVMPWIITSQTFSSPC